METIYIIIKYLTDIFVGNLGLLFILTVGAVGLFVLIRNHKSSVSHKIAYRHKIAYIETEFLTKLEDLIQEFKTYVYSFDVETYNLRKQSNESLFTSKSHHLNARLAELYKIQARLENVRFENIDSVESARREINAYIKSTHEMMIRIRRKTSGNLNRYSHRMLSGNSGHSGRKQKAH